MQGFGAVAALNLSCMSNNVAGRTKQVVASSMVFMYVEVSLTRLYYVLTGNSAWATGNAIGPQVFQAHDAPHYIKAFIAHLVVYCVQIVAIIVLRLRLMRLNQLKRRAQNQAKIADDGAVVEEHIEHKHAFDDLTDKENPDCKLIYLTACETHTDTYFHSPVYLLIARLAHYSLDLWIR